VDWIYLETNPAFWKTTGLGDVTGKRLTEVVPSFPLTNADVLERYGRVAAREIEPQSFETYVPALDKHLLTAVHSPVAGQIASVFADITEVLHQREELAGMKSQFIRNVTHEIRTPLAGFVPGAAQRRPDRGDGNRPAQGKGLTAACARYNGDP
jgi:signal transduction histidine kinase